MDEGERNLNAYDVIILGSGLAGLYAALQLGESDAPPRVLMLSKQTSNISGSSLAQGGVAAVLEEEHDSFALHMEDTLIAGNFTNDVEAVNILVREGPEDVRRVMELGVEFDRAPDGGLEKTLEGGHSRRRIVHHADQTGKEMVEKLLPQVLALPNVTLLEDATACSAHHAVGGFVLDVLHAGRHKQFRGSFLLLATGGIGRVYRRTTNPPVSTGDGVRLAYELGAAIKNLSLVQFHPTAFDAPQVDEQFLISEAVRGEGAFLLNARGERFMERYDPRLELAPRDVVSQSILREARRVGARQFYLDIRHRGADFILARFPSIAAACRERGVDITTEKIPVFPCQHYLMGGVDVDMESRTSIPGLYAAGECAHTGLHGGNRLASNSLPEALVFGRRAAQDILRRLRRAGRLCRDGSQVDLEAPVAQLALGADMRLEMQAIQDTMQEAFFVEPNLSVLPQAAKRMRALYEALKQSGAPQSRAAAELRSLACVAALILEDVEEKADAALVPNG
ncbi:MAG: FAD-binding protein [Oscillospiraceae bacterium]|jgi:L-aspartate oxidase|nr:FAD-binding protein [Oscillospiraceae bacterium]